MLKILQPYGWDATYASLLETRHSLLGLGREIRETTRDARSCARSHRDVDYWLPGMPASAASDVIHHLWLLRFLMIPSKMPATFSLVASSMGRSAPSTSAC